jgi:phage shock protein E
MNWTILVVVVTVSAVVFLLKASATLSTEEARQHLRDGALVVDVRTEAEFQTERLPGVVNVPLDDLAAEFPRRFPDRGRTVLLHCRSGGRSNLAEKELRRLGYKNAFNLGSYARAKKSLGDQVNR